MWEIGRSKDLGQLLVLAFWHHEVEVVGEAPVAHVRGWLGLCSPPELEEAIFVTCGAMAVDAIRSEDGRVQFPSPRFLDPPTFMQYCEKRSGASVTKILLRSPNMSLLES